MRIRASYRTKLALAFLGLAVVTAATVLHVAWRRSREAQLESLRSLLRSVCGTVAPGIDGERHAALGRLPPAEIPSDPRYAELRALAARVRASHPAFHEVFTVALDAGGARLVLSRDPAEAGRPYDTTRFPAMARARSAPDADDDVCPDEHGLTLSGYAPIRDAAGTTVGLLGLDMDGSTVEAMRGRLLGILAAGAAGAVLLGAVLAVFFARRIHRPVAALATGMDRVASGDLSTRVAWPSGDEFERLAGRFNEMTAGLEERRRLRQALELAMEIQQSLLPTGPPKAPGIDVAGFSDYCDETGGDYFDYPSSRPLEDGRIALAIGDVTGHGIGAALLMASGRAALRAGSDRDDGPSGLLGVVNHRLAQDASAGKFMTLFYGLLDPARGSFAWANAGQGGCFVIRGATGAVEVLDAGGPPAGVVDGLPFPEGVVEGLVPGDVVVLGTDGIWETLDAAGVPLGMDGFHALAVAARTRDAAGIAAAVRAAVEAHRGAGPQQDDVTLVVAKLEPTARRAMVSS